jgi:hypothetical protein
VYEAYFPDMAAVKQFIHSMLTDQGFRKASNREFFQMSLSDAVKAVVRVQTIFATALPTGERTAAREHRYNFELPQGWWASYRNSTVPSISSCRIACGNLSRRRTAWHNST